MTRTWVALACTLSLACSTQPTRIRLSIVHEGSWELSALDVHLGDRVEQAPVLSELELWVPDDWAGTQVAVEVRGIRAGEAFATGRTTVVPRLGELVEAQVVLQRPACGVWCSEGASGCRGDAVAICTRGDDGCMAWSTPSACPAEAPFCSLGECRADCVDECAEGEVQCAGPEGIARCGDGDGDPCLEWLDPEPCGPGESCAAGRCVEGCADACEDGVAECRGGARVVCGDLDLDGCLEWSPPAPCGEGESCMAGLCAEGCEDECSEAACAGDRFSQCGQFDRDACLDLSPGVDCRLPGTCEVGACTPSGCTAAPVVCDAPPASTCVDADTLRAFDPIGTCSDGVCSYEASEVACPDGCADGACAGDPCAGVTCDAPPSAECFDASTRRTYAPTGTCAGGTCTYAPTDTPCPHGCALGECSPDLCADVRCESPPFATCVGASTRRTYASTGTCLSGVCSYAATDTPCAEGCAAGTCTCTRSWTTVTVEAPDATGFFPSLALDASGAVHISHGRGGFSDNLGYARRDPTSGTWTLDTADPLGAIPHWTSLAVHPSGAVHISYHHWVTKELRYARRDPASGTWTAVTVDTMGEAGVFSSLAVDGAGAVHIGYHEDLDGDLRYARRDPASGTWSTMVVDAAGDTGSSTSLAVDRSGGVHISYHDATNRDLRYAYRDPSLGTWTSVAVDAAGEVGWHTSLAVDSAGAIHISYYDITNQDLRYAYRDPSSGTWSLSTVDSAGDTGRRTSLAVDASGAVHISYHDYGNDHLRYARRDPVTRTWSTGTVSDDGGSGSSIAVDPGGGVHIAFTRFVDATDGDLMYAHLAACP